MTTGGAAAMAGGLLALLVPLTLLTGYLAGTFYLVPYFSVRGRSEEYNGPTALALTAGQYLLTLKSTSTHRKLHQSDYLLVMRAGFRANLTVEGRCPSGFHLDPSLQPPFRANLTASAKDLASSLPCGLFHERRVQYVPFHPWRPWEESLVESSLDKFYSFSVFSGKNSRTATRPWSGTLISKEEC
jgi:hypothetical protein